MEVTFGDFLYRFGTVLTRSTFMEEIEEVCVLCSKECSTTRYVPICILSILILLYQGKHMISW